MKIRDAGLVLGRILGLRRRRIKNQRQDAIEEARSRVHGRDVAVVGQVARAESNGLLRRSQQDGGKSGEPTLLVAGCLAVKKSVIASGGFVVIVRAFE